MSTTIEQHSDSSFTVTFNGYESILTTVTASGADVEDWLDDIFRIHRRRLSNLVVGLDAEWRPSTTRIQNPVALLQLCVGHRCLVFQILHADYIPAQLSDFLTDDRFTFVGAGVTGDAEKLSDFYGLNVYNAVNLAELAATEMGRMDLKRKSLVDLTYAVMGVNMIKPRWVTMSNWDNQCLDLNQVMYACVDAFVSFEIGRRLLA